MRKVILKALIIGIYFMNSLKGQNICQNFDNIPLASQRSMIGNWRYYNYTPSSTSTVSRLSIVDDPTKGSRIITAQDAAGGSFLLNVGDYGGNWVANGNTCFCFDLKLISDGETALNVHEVSNSIFIFNNLRTNSPINTVSIPTNPSIGFQFILTNKYNESTPWQRICLPIRSISKGEALPSNQFGHWTAYALNGSSIDAAWNQLIHDVTEIGFFIDATGDNTQEIIGVDNICVGCDVSTPTGTISGFKFLDKNCNGKIDRDEQKLPNWTINLTGSGITRTTTTDANGNYTFGNVPFGTYTVSEINQAGYTPSSPANGRHENVVLNAQNTNRINVNFGNCIDLRPCCKNKINIVSSEFIAEAYPTATIGLETFKVQVGSNPNIREVRANIESIEYLNPSIGCTGANAIPYPIFNGSVIDATSNIGSPALVASYMPPLSIYGTNNQVVWSNPSPSSLSAGTEIGLLYLLPGGANSCAKSARICVRFTITDENCNVCEHRFCREISLIPNQKNSNIKSRLKSKVALDLLEESKIVK